MTRQLPIPMPPLLSRQHPQDEIRRIMDYYVQRLQGLSSADAYRSHIRADDIVSELLWEVGLGEVADAYRSAKSQIGFSY